MPLHLFREETSEDAYAAHSIEEAKAIMRATDEDAEPTEWTPIPDDTPMTVDNDGTPVTKTAAEWANEELTPGLRFGAYRW